MFRGKHLRFNIRNSHGNKEQMEWLCAKKQIIQMAFKKNNNFVSLSVRRDCIKSRLF